MQTVCKLKNLNVSKARLPLLSIGVLFGCVTRTHSLGARLRPSKKRVHPTHPLPPELLGRNLAPEQDSGEGSINRLLTVLGNGNTTQSLGLYCMPETRAILLV